MDLWVLKVLGKTKSNAHFASSGARPRKLAFFWPFLLSVNLSHDKPSWLKGEQNNTHLQEATKMIYRQRCPKRLAMNEAFFAFSTSLNRSCTGFKELWVIDRIFETRPLILAMVLGIWTDDWFSSCYLLTWKETLWLTRSGAEYLELTRIWKLFIVTSFCRKNSDSEEITKLFIMQCQSSAHQETTTEMP